MSDLPPFFVFGSPRSGTTLLRSMLDQHPRLAVPPESNFIVQGPGPDEPVQVALERILAHHRFRQWDLPADDVREAVAHRDIRNYAALIDAIFRVYAERRGKTRWGDKTPKYLFYVPQLRALFPAAKFIHIIRDGREVAASMCSLGWNESILSAADRWRRMVRVGRSWRRLGPDHYHELRLDQLIAEPEATLRELCAFLGEPFEPEMLDYPGHAHASLSHWVRPYHPNLVLPPTPGLRDWAAGLSPGERGAVEAICARRLREVGIGVPHTAPRDHLVAANHVARTRVAELFHPEWRLNHLTVPADEVSASSDA